MTTAEPSLQPATGDWRVWLKYWAPVILWMGCISTFSGDPFSASNTHRYIDPILRFFLPQLSPAGFQQAHSVVRKSAHFVEFFILGWLVYWALRRGRVPRWRAAWALAAFAFAAGFSLLDELPSSFRPDPYAIVAR